MSFIFWAILGLAMPFPRAIEPTGFVGVVPVFGVRCWEVEVTFGGSRFWSAVLKYVFLAAEPCAVGDFVERFFP
jgi:hypothetical protein